MSFRTPNLLPVNASTFEDGTHSWVTTGGNTTLAVVTGAFLSGTRSLRATATAAGAVQLISPRWAVTAGVEHIGRIPIRLNTATAGKTATARITWFDAPSGGNSLGATDYSLNLSNQTGWQTSNYTYSTGIAPAGAMSATLKLTVAGMAAGEQINIDDVYACVAPNRAGNLVDLNVGGFECDLSGWTISGATAAVRYNAILAAGTGYSCMLATAAAAGAEMAFGFAAPVPVTAGTQYVAYAAVQAAGAAVMQTRYQLSWYDAAGTLLSSDERVVTVNSTVQRLALVATAPAAAASCRVWLRPTATAAGHQFAIDDVSVCVAPNRTGNLLTYNEYSFEDTLPGWTIAGDTAAAARAYLTSNITDGFYALSYTPTARSIHTLSQNRLVPVVAGRTYAVGATVFGRNRSGQPTEYSVRVLVDWYDAAGNLFQADNPDGFYPRAVEDGEIHGSSATETRTCPEGAANARVIVQIDHTTSLCDAYFVDNVYLAEANAEYTLLTDNATGAIVLTINSSPSWGTGGTITIQRVHQDGSMHYVRGYGVEYNRAPYAGSPIVVEDYEAPLGETVWYRVEWFNAEGVAGYRQYTQSIPTPTLPDGDYVWFKSPGLPALNTTVMMETPPTWARAARTARYDIVGRKNPIQRTAVRAGRTASISVLVWDPAAHELFDSLLDSGLPALIQAMPGYGLDGNLYVSVGNVEAAPLVPDAREDGWRWTLEIAEIDRPAGGMQGSAGLTWQDINDGYDTWDDVFAAHESWATVLTKG
ncbi:hypothetical protein [Streptomyces sp. NPDC050145]|uniref:hypothetical protein n=1 Tax=Streptomyces sp. NPDC050145 TaxID=3365602 RepID=UPI0037972F42